MKLRRPIRLGLLRLSILAIVVGVVTGFGAVLFRALIGLIHNIAFLGVFSVPYDSSAFTPPGPWRAFIILVPVIGGLIVTFLITNFAPEARGHGVPEVMDAIYYREGLIRPVVALIKSLASALSIGTGASVGREGPIIQIGAALGSTLGQIVRMAPWQRITLVAAGAGAGIAATFNTPIGGVMFAIELMMPELSARTFLPVALATGTATFVGRIFFGIHPAFVIPSALLASQAPASLTALLLYALLGGLIGLAAAGFIRGLSFAEDALEWIENPYLRNIAGMLFIGVLIYALFVGAGHYHVEGVGYSTIQAILNGSLSLPALLLLLFVAKLAATSVSIGAGASGGIFSPSLFMGATIGGAFGLLVNAIVPISDFSVTTCAIVGMAAMVGGGTGAAMTAVTMIFEMTRDYDLVMPSIIAVALAIGVRRLLSVENIYTIKLVGRGHFVPKALHANMFLVRRAREVMRRDVTILTADADFDAFLRENANKDGFRHVVVIRGNHIAGVVRVNTSLRRGVEQAYSGVRLGDVAQRNFTIAREADIMFDVVQRMARHDAAMAVVVKAHGRGRPDEILGIISKEHIADSVAESIRPFG
ncbi:MAG: chloride channel protein [Hyphomicrobiales bacterium]|nr:chloride channel protein [Hyphomicrobiales bacterium]MDE1971695.1 chloride channel protein [Hyphomicrobiales bacterium]